MNGRWNGGFRASEVLRRALTLEWWTSGDDPPCPAPQTGRDQVALLGRPALLGLLATIAVAFGASQSSSPFALKVQGAWYFGVPSLTTPPGRGILLSLVASYGGMFLLLRVWWELTALLRRCPGVPMWAVWGVFALWLVPLLVGPPLFSRDVYSYAAQGDMVTRGINPYLHGPSSLGWGDPYLNPVDRLWYATPAPYGPLFLGLDAGIVGLTGHHALATVVGLRLLALGGVVLAGAFLPTLARSSGRDPAAVFALAILNPVTLLHLIAGAHNDALMAGFLVAGLALARNRHPVAGVVMCALGAAVKAPAALGILYIGWHWMGPGLPRRERVRPMVSAVMLGGVVLGLLSEVTRLGWGWVRALGAPGAVHSVIDPTTIFGIVTGTFTRLLHLGLRTGQMTSMGRGLGMAVAVVAGVRLLLMSDRLGMVRAAAISLWVVVVLGPVIQPWYLGWPIMLLAPVAGGRLRRLLVATTVAGAFIGFPGGWLLLDELARSSVWAVALSVAVLVSIPGPPVLAWARRQLDGRRRLLTPAPLG